MPCPQKSEGRQVSIAVRQKDRCTLMEAIFSRRLPADLAPSALDRLWRGLPGLTNLMQSNPTQCGFDYPAVEVSMVGPQALAYVPEPFGLPSARATLADYLATAGQPVAPERLLLTASTSEAYGMLFKLLCNPGDAVAVGTPAYPLVPHLAELDAVRTLHYSLELSDRWRIDMDSVRAVLQRGVRALVLIAPNNPTGAGLRPNEAAQLADLCRAAQVPIILDEVFAPYTAEGHVSPVPTLAKAPMLFVLNGLSKAAALPQLKLGWMAVHGDAELTQAALQRLEWIADAYLSVSTTVQQALPALLRAAPALQQQICARVRGNLAILRHALQGTPAVTLLPWEGGWYAVLQVPQVQSEEAWAQALAERAGVLVHPGYFYGFCRRGFLVVGLLLPESEFAPACSRLIAVLRACTG